MNFNHLEYAAEIAKSGSISRAAQQLLLSQPYLSGMMKGLEEELGYQIFVRTKKGIELTRQGEAFMKSANLILMERKKIKEIGRKVEEEPLNISSFYAKYVMTKFLQFRANSEVKLPDRIREMGNKEVMDSITSGNGKLGFVFYAEEKQKKYQEMAEQRGLKWYQLFESMQMYAMMAKSHPLAGKEEISIEELKKYAYVAYDDISSRKFLEMIGLSENGQLLEVSDRGGFYDAIQSGNYLSAMTSFNPAEEEALVFCPLKEKRLNISAAYVTAASHRLTRREKEFLGCLKKSQ